jgi:hypothetical protein
LNQVEASLLVLDDRPQLASRFHLAGLHGIGQVLGPNRDLLTFIDPIGDNVEVTLEVMPSLILQMLFGKLVDCVLRGRLDSMSNRAVVGEQVVSFRITWFAQCTVQYGPVFRTTNELKFDSQHIFPEYLRLFLLQLILLFSLLFFERRANPSNADRPVNRSNEQFLTLFDGQQRVLLANRLVINEMQFVRVHVLDGPAASRSSTSQGRSAHRKSSELSIPNQDIGFKLPSLSFSSIKFLRVRESH